MARVKLTEHAAKTLLFQTLGMPYAGIALQSGQAPSQAPVSGTEYVVKVDQGIKKRMKQGLVKLKVTSEKLKDAVLELEKKGHSRFIAEEMVPHAPADERYMAMEREREGIIVTYSRQGGIDIEEAAGELKRVVLAPSHPELVSGSVDKKMLISLSETADKELTRIEQELEIPSGFLVGLREFFEKYYVSFLEINPLVIKNDTVFVLDLAVEVDSTAQFLVKDAWNEEDIVAEQHKTPEEQTVAALNNNSQAALSLTVLNPNGSVWVLLSGGGASITVADEVYNLGFGHELGNYGEYSGNPNAEETYLYTTQVLKLMMKSERRRLMLIIGGGVANFTDIRTTFKGVLKALNEYKENMKKKEIKIFVRRGGPHQQEGLLMIEEFARAEGMYGLVAGPELPLHEIVRAAIAELQKGSIE